jgi:WD40 repeat protein
MSMPSKIMSLTMSPDRKVLAAGDDIGNIYLIPTDDYTAFTSYKNQSNWVSGICFSPDNVFIASVDWDFAFGLYSVPQKKSIQNSI